MHSGGTPDVEFRALALWLADHQPEEGAAEMGDAQATCSIGLDLVLLTRDELAKPVAALPCLHTGILVIRA